MHPDAHSILEALANNEALDPKVFLDAADLIADRKYDYCCLAIRAVCATRMNTRIHLDFLKYNFKPDRVPEYSSWFGRNIFESRNARILVLLLCAELAKDKDHCVININSTTRNITDK